MEKRRINCDWWTPSNGKTALAISLVRNIAILNRTPIAYFSLEMSTVQFMNRFLSNVSNVEINHAELYSEKEQALLDDAEKIIERCTYLSG